MTKTDSTKKEIAIKTLSVYNIFIKTDEQRITVNSKQCGARPCIRGMRIRVTDVLELLAAGLNFEQILDEMPDLEKEDIIAAINYAAKSIDHPIIAA
ncbi:MAG: hypothetical protein ACI9E1_000771 [Cryomorphaceae bacterium]|jgi:uncharacterized protein (DUF433 family)